MVRIPFIEKNEILILKKLCNEHRLINCSKQVHFCFSKNSYINISGEVVFDYESLDRDGRASSVKLNKNLSMDFGSVLFFSGHDIECLHNSHLVIGKNTYFIKI